MLKGRLWELALNENYTFENFVAKGDDFAFNTAKRIAEKPGKSYNPVVFYGGHGSGKTHLIQAIGNELKKQYNVIYTTAELFCEEFIAAIEEDEIKIALIKNDDIVRIANNTETDMRYIVSSLNEIDARIKWGL